MKNTLFAVPVSILAGETDSSIVTTDGRSAVGIFLPANFIGTAVSFQAAHDEAGTYSDVVTADGAVSITVAAGQYLSLDSMLLGGCRFLKIVSNTAQVADGVLYAMLRNVA